MVELSGDSRLTVAQRLQYLLCNLARKVVQRGPIPIVERFFPSGIAAGSGTPSPSRLLTEAYLVQRLPQLLPVGPLSVLEIGCETGSLCRRLADLGYSGTYIGIDVVDRFDPDPIPTFERRFIRADIQHSEPATSCFDFIVSVSVLECVPHDTSLIDRLPKWLNNEGVELHFAPRGWGLAAYLWHGWRQYPLAAIGKRFGAAAVAVPLGSLPTMLLHFLFITISEILFRADVRGRWLRVYQYLLDMAITFDQYLTWCPTMYAVRRQR
jgi:SAM-dependent methyltransferase